ncbi:AAA family ATPase [Streptomyces sp. HC44]|uniref:AAA family ATPase n=1 Tax=Streptomyces scabichelini TaxID=2711217 RepID=A0A6G4VJZ1_9ACTN|nr:AAA family ATPase [Streptomyces scabichelini]NGO14482.1 AAA family ATPase [Streptomyces scabichelini]
MLRMRGNLLERDREFGQLLAAVGEARAGHGSVAVVVGEAGIGKTSLVRAFTRAVSPGVRVLTGACDDLMAPRTLGPLRDAARGTKGPLERALAGDCAGQEVFAALSEDLSGAQPAVLVVEDVHWADDATIDALTHLVGRIGELGAVLVLTFRDDEVRADHPLQRLLGALVRAATVRIPLRPLSPAAVTSLAAGTGRDPQALYAVTRGNPFYVTEVLADAPGAVPDTVADAVLARGRLLGEDCLAALEQLSVVPTHVGLELADALLGDGLDALAEAEARGMVEVRPQGLAFRHELARRVIEHALPTLRRRALNRTVVHALRAQQRPDLDRLVHHAVQADDADAVVEYAPRAAREATRAGSHRQALTHFEAVLRHRDRFTPAERARLMDDYAWELFIAHRFADAVNAGREAVRLYGPLHDPVPLGEALVRLSRHLYMTGATDAAEEAAERAVHVLEPTGHAPARSFALAHRGALFTLTGHSERAVPILYRARDLAGPAGRSDLVAMCLNYLGVAQADLCEPAHAQHRLRESLEMSLRKGHHESAARSFINLAELLYRFGDLAALDRYVDEGLTFTRERGFWAHAYHLDVHRCLSLVRRGETTAAEEGLRALVEDRHDLGMLHVYSVPPYARLLARRGEARAEALLAEAWRRALRQRSLPGLAYAGIAYAEWAWLSRRPDVATTVQDTLLPYLSQPGRAPFRAELLCYTARSGLPTEAFDGCPEPYAASLRGDWRAAAEGWAGAGMPYEQALELARSGEPDLTLRALRLLEDLGAHAAASLVRERLRSLGLRRAPRGPARGTRAHPAGLTARQSDVLDLVAEGLTNAQIAGRLVLSVRTVDHHVAAILGKLGASSRREAAKTAQTLGVLRLGAPLPGR